MNVRRCPNCKNMVGCDSLACPICGKTHAQVMAGRCVRWLLTSALLLWIAYEFIVKGHKIISG